MLSNRIGIPIKQDSAILILVRKAGLPTKDLKGSMSELSVGAKEKEERRKGKGGENTYPREERERERRPPGVVDPDLRVGWMTRSSP